MVLKPNKLISFIFTLAVLVGMIFLPNTKPVQAVDFGTWVFGTSEILEIKADDNGIVWAVGGAGRIATFNGIDWTIKSNITSFLGGGGVHTQPLIDTKNKTVYAFGTISYNNIICIFKWTEEEGWVNMGIVGPTTDQPCNIVLDRDGVPYTMLASGKLMKWDGVNSFIDLGSLYDATVAWDASKYMLSRGYIEYDPVTHIIYVTWQPSGGRASYAAFDLNTNTFINKGNYSVNNGADSVVLHGRTLILALTSGVLTGRNVDTGAVVTVNGVGNMPKLMVHKNTVLATARGVNLEAGYDITNGVSLSNGAAVFYVKTATIGNYGEYYVAGTGGKMVAILKGTAYTDSSVFTEYIAAAAKEAAIEGKDASLAAKISADQAKIAADDAKASADLASTRAQAAVEAVSNANGNTITAVRDDVSTALEEARSAKTAALSANTKIDTLQTSITNIANSVDADKIPPTVKLRTVSGARATTGNSINAMVMVSDNRPGPFQYSINSGAFVQLPDNKIVSLPVTNWGENVITVTVKDQAGNEGMDIISIRGL